jgi:hypothetical protein
MFHGVQYDDAVCFLQGRQGIQYGRTDLQYFHFAGTLLTLQCTGSMNAHTLIAQQQISDSQNKRFFRHGFDRLVRLDRLDGLDGLGGLGG